MNRFHVKYKIASIATNCKKKYNHKSNMPEKLHRKIIELAEQDGWSYCDKLNCFVKGVANSVYHAKDWASKKQIVLMYRLKALGILDEENKSTK